MVVWTLERDFEALSFDSDDVDDGANEAEVGDDEIDKEGV